LNFEVTARQVAPLIASEENTNVEQKSITRRAKEPLLFGSTLDVRR